MGARKQLWIRCDPCEHTFQIAELPLDISLLDKLVRKTACPLCRKKGKNLFLAREADIQAAEQSAESNRVREIAL